MPSERTAALQPAPPATVPFSQQSAAVTQPSVKRSSSPGAPYFGGTLVREPQVPAAPPRERSAGNALSSLRESLDESFESVPRMDIRSPEWLRQMFRRRHSTGTEAHVPAAPTQAAPTQAKPSPNTAIIAKSTAPSMFSPRPNNGIQRVSHESHSFEGIPSEGPGARYQTQYRSLRDGHNKPGSLFDPHAWQAPDGFDDESSVNAGPQIQRAAWSSE